MEEQTIINKTERPNSISFRWGGVGSDIKLYFNDIEDLMVQILRLEDASGPLSERIENIKKNMSNKNEIKE